MTLTYFRVKNLLNTSLAIEDLGLVLPAYGVAPITADARARSADLKRAGRHVHVEAIYVPPAVSAPAFAAPSLPPPRPEPPPNPPAASLAGIAELNTKMDALLSVIASLGNRVAVAEAVRPAQRASAPEPMYVPSRIVPDAEARVTPVEAVVEKDVGASRAALRKARRSGS